MAGNLIRLTSLRLSSLAKKPITLAPCMSRAMSGSPFEGGPPTTTLGGIFKKPSGAPPPSNEELTGWVNKEMEGQWKSYGYDYNDQKMDSDWHKMAMFTLVTMPVLFVAIWAYQPDRRMRDWAIRESYLVLREREAAGIEPISKDLVDPQLILDNLPSDDELKEAGVVITI